MTLPPTAIPATSLEDESRAAQTRLRRRRQLIIGLRIAVLVIVLGGWELAARLKWIDPFFFSQPTLIFAQIQDWFVNGTSQGPLLTQVWVTLEETGIGFVIGSVAGVICGIVLGRNKLMADVASKIALAVVMVFFVVFGNAFQGVREADRYLIANAQILGASRRQITTSVVIPSALSWILASLHVSFGFALVGAVVGEFLGSKQGIGLLISTAQGAFNASGVFAAMIVLAVVALAADYLLTWLEKRLLKWRPAAF